MNTIPYLHNEKRHARIGMAALSALILFADAAVVAADKTEGVDARRNQSAIITGSGERYQTTVESDTKGSLSAQDLHQASLLSARVVGHLNEAVRDLIDQDPAAAKPEIAKALTLVQLVRGLLPVTTVTTVIKDAGGKEVYRDVDTVQNERIPLYSGMIAVDVVEPIIDAKKQDVTMKGLRLVDADVIYTSMLADLGYLERKLKRASALLDKPEEALAQLVLAQTQGIELVTNKTDEPLVKVQRALRLAERMVEEGNHTAARNNLQLAQVQLGAYRVLLGKEAPKVVQQLEKDIAALMDKTEEKDAAKKIRGFWERAVSLFREEQGQARIVEQDEGKAPKKSEKQ